ncbi:hypothetical protein [Flavobacterium sp. HJSW_4]|uniref:ATP-binding protein n=1 Tax=Flavobacterium sp. HJSW_4 TaxID=3344660 RepID=UPI0035F434E5
MSCKKEKVAVAKKTDNTAEVRRLTILGDAYFDKFEYSKAFKIYERVVLIADTVKDRVDYVDALISIALIQHHQGNYIESEFTATKVFPYLKYLKKPRFAWETYRVIADNYLATQDYNNALVYAKKAYNLNTGERRKANALANIALVYLHQRKYKKAIEIYSKVATTGYYADKKKANTLEDFELLDYAIMKSNIGNSYASLGDTAALAYYKEVLKIRIELNDVLYLPNTYSNLSDYYAHSNPSLARKYAETAYKHALVVNTYKQKKYALECLIRTSTGNRLKKYSDIYIHFIDSFSKISLSQKNQFANIKYDFKKDKEENLELKTERVEAELEIQRQKNRSFILYVVISIVFISFIILIFYMRKKGKKENNNEVFKNEMRISEKLQFELEKEIDKILVFTEDNDLEKEENKEIFLSQLNNIYSKTRNISKENSKIITDENFEKALKEMISGYTSSKLNIIINGLDTFSWLKIDRVKKITVFRVLQEIFDQNKIINNASLASITFKKEEKNILIIYTNNGTEFQDLSVNLNKIFANIENRLKSVKGFLEISSNQSETFKIFIKLPL